MNNYWMNEWMDGLNGWMDDNGWMGKLLDMWMI